MPGARSSIAPGLDFLISAARGKDIMRVVVTRPQSDGERTAAALRARGHDVLLAPLMRVEPLAANLAGTWSAVMVTSANAVSAIAGNPARAGLVKLPLFAVGQRSADAARDAGFSNVRSADGDARDLVRMLVTQRMTVKAPMLYLAGEDRAADLVGELSAHGISAEMRIVYRAVTAPFPPALVAALADGKVDAVLHFSRRSAENYVAGAKDAGIAGPALVVRQLCLSAQVAEPLAAAGQIFIAARPDETALMELLQA
jgi:uroporphyrinogen-III synthase